jgi:hypothetical protein
MCRAEQCLLLSDDYRLQVTNANFMPGTITTDKFSGPENLNPQVTVSAANFDDGVLMREPC